MTLDSSRALSFGRNGSCDCDVGFDGPAWDDTTTCVVGAGVSCGEDEDGDGDDGRESIEMTDAALSTSSQSSAIESRRFSDILVMKNSYKLIQGDGILMSFEGGG